MKKQAGKYMGESNFPMMQQGFGGMGHGSMMFGLNSGNSLTQAAMAGQHNPNAAKNLHMPTYNAATPEGIMAAAQKVAEYSYKMGVDGRESEALPEWVEAVLNNGLVHSKQAEDFLNGKNREEKNTLRGNYQGLGLLSEGGSERRSKRGEDGSLFESAPYSLSSFLSLTQYWQSKSAVMVPGPGGLPPQGAAVMGGTPMQPPMMGGPGGGMPTPGAAQPGQPAPPGQPPGAPPMGGASPMSQQPPPGAAPQFGPPPTAPMSDAPPPMLPMNPRPPTHSPKSSMQAQNEANVMRLMEQKRMAESGGMPGQANQDIQAQAFASDSKTADDMADMDYNNPSQGNSEPHKGWEWKALNHSINEGHNRWMPRHFTNKHTPITELLSSPGKGALLGGLLGAGLGGVAGGVGGSMAGLPSAQTAGLAAGGAGLGGLLGVLV